MSMPKLLLLFLHSETIKHYDRDLTFDWFKLVYLNSSALDNFRGG